MRKCIDEGTLQAWFDGELDANAAADVAAHLHSCIHCGEAARTLEVENLILSQGLSAEFVEAVPTERLRQRVKSAVASGLQVTTVPTINGSWVNRVRNLCRHFFLNLQALRIGIHHPGKFADPDYPTARDVRDPGLTGNRRQVMLAMALEADSTEHNHLVIAFDVLEGLLQNQSGILAITSEKFLEGTSNATGSFD